MIQQWDWGGKGYKTVWRESIFHTHTHPDSRCWRERLIGSELVGAGTAGYSYCRPRVLAWCWMSGLWQWTQSLLSELHAVGKAGIYGIYGALQISARKAPQRQGVDNLLSTDMRERGRSKCPAVLTLLTRQGQAPRTKVRSLLWCLHQYLQLCLLPTHHGGWWVVVRALFWSWKLDPWAGCNLKARDYLCVPIRIAHQSPKQRVHILGFELKY